MIKKIRIGNFKCIKEVQEIDFTANREENLKNTNSNEGLLKSIAIFGENGAGKTTILEAISIFVNEIIGSKNHSNLNSNKKDSSFFAFDFFLENTSIAIEFKIYKPLKGEKKIFDEKILINNKALVFKNDSDQIPSDILKIRFAYYNKMLRDSDAVVIQNLISFLSHSIYYQCDEKKIITFDDKVSFNLNTVMEVNDYLNDSVNFEKVNKLLSQYYQLFKLGKFEFPREDAKISKFNILVAQYYNKKTFLIHQESSGHKDLIKFMQFFSFTFNNPGFVFVDEFNSSFHTELSKMLINLFHSESKSSQFMFVTQDTALMDSDILRADQIYIINRNERLETEFDRISNYDTRPTQNYQKMYRSSVISKQPLFKRLYKDAK